MIKRRESLEAEKKAKGEEHLETYGGLREEIGMKTYLHSPMDYAKTLKLALRVRDLDLPQRKKRYTTVVVGRRAKKMHILRSCGKTKESRTHIVGECEMYDEERDVLDEENRRT